MRFTIKWRQHGRDSNAQTDVQLDAITVARCISILYERAEIWQGENCIMTYIFGEVVA